MVAFALLPIIRLLAPYLIKAGILYYGTKTGIKIADAIAERIAQEITDLVLKDKAPIAEAIRKK